MADPPRLQIPVAQQSFKRSFEEFGFDLDSPQDPTNEASGSGAAAASGSGANGGEGGSERNKRQRSNDLSDNDSSTEYLSFSTSSSGGQPAASSSTAAIAAPSLPIPIASAPSNLSAVWSPPDLGSHWEDVDMIASSLGAEAGSVVEDAPAGAEEEQQQESASSLQRSIDRFHAFDADISILRPARSRSRTRSPPPVLPPLSLPPSELDPTPAADALDALSSVNHILHSLQEDASAAWESRERERRPSPRPPVTRRAGTGLADFDEWMYAASRESIWDESRAGDYRLDTFAPLQPFSIAQDASRFEPVAAGPSAQASLERAERRQSILREVQRQHEVRRIEARREARRSELGASTTAEARAPFVRDDRGYIAGLRERRSEREALPWHSPLPSDDLHREINSRTEPTFLPAPSIDDDLFGRSRRERRTRMDRLETFLSDTTEVDRLRQRANDISERLARSRRDIDEALSARSRTDAVNERFGRSAGTSVRAPGGLPTRSRSPFSSQPFAEYADLMLPPERLGLPPRPRSPPVRPPRARPVSDAHLYSHRLDHLESLEHIRRRLAQADAHLSSSGAGAERQGGDRAARLDALIFPDFADRLDWAPGSANPASTSQSRSHDANLSSLYTIDDDWYSSRRNRRDVRVPTRSPGPQESAWAAGSPSDLGRLPRLVRDRAAPPVPDIEDVHGFEPFLAGLPGGADAQGFVRSSYGDATSPPRLDFRDLPLSPPLSGDLRDRDVDWDNLARALPAVRTPPLPAEGSAEELGPLALLRSTEALRSQMNDLETRMRTMREMYSLTTGAGAAEADPAPPSSSRGADFPLLASAQLRRSVSHRQPSASRPESSAPVSRNAVHVPTSARPARDAPLPGVLPRAPYPIYNPFPRGAGERIPAPGRAAAASPQSSRAEGLRAAEPAASSLADERMDSLNRHVLQSIDERVGRITSAVEDMRRLRRRTADELPPSLPPLTIDSGLGLDPRAATAAAEHTPASDSASRGDASPADLPSGLDRHREQIRRIQELAMESHAARMDDLRRNSSLRRRPVPSTFESASASASASAAPASEPLGDRAHSLLARHAARHGAPLAFAELPLPSRLSSARREAPELPAASTSTRTPPMGRLPAAWGEIGRDSGERVDTARRFLARRRLGAGRTMRPLSDFMADEDFDSSYESLLNLEAILGEARPRRTEEATISAMPKGKFAEWKREGSDERCPICLDDYAPEDDLLKVPSCGHWLHQGCLEQWLQGASTCPVCRSRVGESAAASSSTSARRVPRPYLRTPPGPPPDRNFAFGYPLAHGSLPLPPYALSRAAAAERGAYTPADPLGLPPFDFASGTRFARYQTHRAGRNPSASAAGPSEAGPLTARATDGADAARRRADAESRRRQSPPSPPGFDLAAAQARREERARRLEGMIANTRALLESETAAANASSPPAGAAAAASATADLLRSLTDTYNVTSRPLYVPTPPTPPLSASPRAPSASSSTAAQASSAGAGAAGPSGVNFTPSSAGLSFDDDDDDLYAERDGDGW